MYIYIYIYIHVCVCIRSLGSYSGEAMHEYLLTTLRAFIEDPFVVDLASLEGTTAPTRLATLLYVMLARPKLLVLENVEAVEVLLELIKVFLRRLRYSFAATSTFNPASFHVPNSRTIMYMARSKYVRSGVK